MTRRLFSHPFLWANAVKWMVSVVLAVWLICHMWRQYPCTDTVPFDIDDIQYHAIAVNLLHGHGYRYELVADPGLYGIPGTKDSPHIINRNRAIAELGEFRILPAYPSFVAAIYAISGTHPKHVKIVQLVLVTICVSLIPLIGDTLWKNWGWFAGLLAWWWYLPWIPVLAVNGLQTESMQLVTITACFAAYALFLQHQTTVRAVILGLAVTILFNIKGSAFFLVPLLGAAVWIVSSGSWRKTVSYIAPFILFSVAWSAYASWRSDEMVIFDRQHNQLLMNGHNKQALHSNGRGTWEEAPEFDAVRAGTASPASTVGRMYLQSPTLLVGILKVKCQDFWGRLPFPGFVLLSVLGVVVIGATNQKWQRHHTYLALGAASAVFGLGCASLLLRGSTLLGALLLAGLITLSMRTKPSTAPPLPDAYLLLFPVAAMVNIFLITLIFYGFPRHMAPFTPFIILLNAFFPLLLIALSAHVFTAIRRPPSPPDTTPTPSNHNKT